MTQDANEGRLDAWIGQEAYDPDGSKIGKIADLYYDTDSGQLEWLAVTTGLFGTKVGFVPIAGSHQGDEGLVVAYDKSTVKEAPRIDPDGQLTQDEELQLYAHYGLEARPPTSGDDERDAQTSSAPTEATMPEAGASTGTGSIDSDTDERADPTPTGTTSSTGPQPTSGFRLRRYLVTESRQFTVPVTHEEVRLEHEDGTPVDDEEGTADER